MPAFGDRGTTVTGRIAGWLYDAATRVATTVEVWLDLGNRVVRVWRRPGGISAGASTVSITLADLDLPDAEVIDGVSSRVSLELADLDLPARERPDLTSMLLVRLDDVDLPATEEPDAQNTFLLRLDDVDLPATEAPDGASRVSLMLADLDLPNLEPLALASVMRLELSDLDLIEDIKPPTLTAMFVLVRGIRFIRYAAVPATVGRPAVFVDVQYDQNPQFSSPASSSSRVISGIPISSTFFPFGANHYLRARARDRSGNSVWSATLELGDCAGLAVDLAAISDVEV